jgi:hypothetical protein
MADATFIMRNGVFVEIDLVDGKVVEVPDRIRCPECAEVVRDFFDHVADGCQDA